MEIQPIVYDAFASLVSCSQSKPSSADHGCARYMTTDRHVAGRVYLEQKSEAFRFSVLCLARGVWDIRAPSRLYDRFEEAETALFEAMRQEVIGKPVTIQEVPLKMRFGKGRTRGATPTVEA